MDSVQLNYVGDMKYVPFFKSFSNLLGLPISSGFHLNCVMDKICYHSKVIFKITFNQQIS